MENIVLRRVDGSLLKIHGRNLEVEDRTTGKIYISNKKYVDKLFNEMGYRNLSVIKILEDYAGKVISEIGTLHESGIFLDEDKDSFIVTSPDSIDRLNDIFALLEKKGFVEVPAYYKEFDSCHYFDQYLFKSPVKEGLYFAVYPSLATETVRVLSVAMNGTTGIISGILDEGDFDLRDAGVVRDIFVTLESNIDATAGIDYDQELSVNEYVDLLCTAGYVKKKWRGKCALTEDFSDELKSILGPADGAVDDYNIMTWIQKRINSSGVTFQDAYMVFSPMASVSKFSIWDIKDFYTKNAKEETDLFLLNA